MSMIERVDVIQAFGESNALLRILYSPVMQIIASTRGFIAGGFAEALLKQRVQYGAVDSRTTYSYLYKKQGDVDVFFRTHDDFCEACAAMRSMSPCEQRSPTGCAVNYYVAPEQIGVSYHSMQHRSIKIQLVGSHHDDPEKLIADFDIKNSMVGFDISNAYIVDQWYHLFKTSTLDVVTQNFVSIMHKTLHGARICKYAKKGYRKLSDNALATLIKCADEFKAYDQDSKIFINDRFYVPARRVQNSIADVLDYTDVPIELLPKFKGLATRFIPIIDHDSFTRQSQKQISAAPVAEYFINSSNKRAAIDAAELAMLKSFAAYA